MFALHPVMVMLMKMKNRISLSARFLGLAIVVLPQTFAIFITWPVADLKVGGKMKITVTQVVQPATLIVVLVCCLGTVGTLGLMLTHVRQNFLVGGV